MTSQLLCFMHRHASSSIISPPCHPPVKDGAVLLIHLVRVLCGGDVSVFSLVIVLHNWKCVGHTLKQLVDVCSSRLLIKKTSHRPCNRSNTTFYDRMTKYYKLWTYNYWWPLSQVFFWSSSQTIKYLLSAKECNGIVYLKMKVYSTSHTTEFKYFGRTIF